MSSTLLPPNATTQEKEMACAIARISCVPIPMRDLWNPETCPSSLLPWLAWTLSVDSWSSSWTDAQKRSVIASSVDLHRTKGTLGSIQRVLAPFGLSGAVQEWWQTTPPGPAHTFTITMAVVNTPQDVQDSIVAAVQEVKPVRSAMTLLTQQGFTASPTIAGVSQSANFVRLSGVANNVIAGSAAPTVTATLRPASFTRLSATANP